MKKFIALSVVLLFSGSAWACPPIQGSNVDMKMVGAFAKLGEAMGVGCPAFYKQTLPNMANIEFISKDEDLSKWSKMMTVTILDTVNEDAATATLPLLDNMMKNIQSAGGQAKVLSKTDTKNVNESQRGIWYTIKYNVGKGSNREEGVAVIRTFGYYLAAIVQYQQRKDGLADSTMHTFMSMNGIGN